MILNANARVQGPTSVLNANARVQGPTSVLNANARVLNSPTSVLNANARVLNSPTSVLKRFSRVYILAAVMIGMAGCSVSSQKNPSTGNATNTSELGNLAKINELRGVMTQTSFIKLYTLSMTIDANKGKIRSEDLDWALSFVGHPLIDTKQNVETINVDVLKTLQHATALTADQKNRIYTVITPLLTGSKTDKIYGCKMAAVINDPRLTPSVIKLTKDKDKVVSEAAKEALKHIQK